MTRSITFPRVIVLLAVLLAGIAVIDKFFSAKKGSKVM